MRLSDLDALRESIKERYEGTEDSTGKWRTYGSYWEACEMIENAPTVDAVPVVRKPVKGYEGYYEVDNLARVFSISRSVSVNDNGRIYDKSIVSRQMRQALHSKGYKVVSLTKNGITKTVFVHRIVAEAFLENEQGLPMINHKDEDKTNNFIENLEWCDAQYNTLYGNGRKKRLKKIRGVPLSNEHKKKISDGLKGYYEEHESKSKGKVSEKRKAVTLREEKNNPPLHFNSIHEADAYLGGGCRANITRAIRRKGKVKGYYADWYCADGERVSE